MLNKKRLIVCPVRCSPIASVKILLFVCLILKAVENVEKLYKLTPNQSVIAFLIVEKLWKNPFFFHKVFILS